VYGIFHNALGQTVDIATATITPAARHPQTALLVAQGLSNGDYVVTLVVVTPGGVVISPVSLLYESI
jgi:uncharacterized membrane protein